MAILNDVILHAKSTQNYIFTKTVHAMIIRTRESLHYDFLELFVHRMSGDCGFLGLGPISHGRVKNGSRLVRPERRISVQPSKLINMEGRKTQKIDSDRCYAHGACV